MKLRYGWSYCACASLSLLVLFSPAHAQIVASGQALTVTTANAVATFQGPDLAGLTNTATGESYLRLAPSSPLANLETLAGPGQLVAASDWTTSVQNGTTVASLTVQDSIRSVTLAVSVDAASQEIVIKMSGQATQAGVTAAYWGIGGLDLDAGRLIVPASTGVVIDRQHRMYSASTRYPEDWTAQMFVYETSAGSMVLYSTDPLYLFKQLRIASRTSSTLDLSIATDAIGPWPDATSVPTVEWRLKMFSGDWRTAAAVYRDWLAANRPRPANASPAWVQQIRAVVTSYSNDASLLDSLATVLTPSQTLIYLVGWRQAGYDHNYPDYTASPGVATFVAKAHSLGFKVMLHTDLIGVTPSNPDFASVQSWQLKDPRSLSPMGWHWDYPPTEPTRFAYINPASSVYRNLFVQRVGAAMAAIQPDALHLDISGPMYSDGNGAIEGMSYPQGSAQLHKDLLAAFPGLALGGEGMNDVIYRYNAFAQNWWVGDIWGPGRPPGHPIVNFLWNSQGSGRMQYYGHLGQPFATDPALKGFVSQLERQAILPTLSIEGQNDLDLANADNARLLRWLQSWQANGFQPDWTGSWNGVLIPYKAAPGSTTTAALVDTGSLVGVSSGGAPVYQRAHDAAQVDTASYALGWPAFDSTRIYGLDPTKQYWLDTVPRPTTSHVSSLPSTVEIGAQSMISSNFALIQLAPAPSYDFIANLWAATVGTNENGIDGPVGFGATVTVGTATVAGVARQGIFMHPPYAQGHAGGETFVEWSLPVPPSTAFTFSVGVDDGATCTDGVTFRVAVNGTEAWRQNVLHQGWTDGRVDLSAYAGTTVRLRIVTNPGPASNAGCDWAYFSALALSSTGPLTVSVPFVLGPGATPSGFFGSGALSNAGPGALRVDNVSVPGLFALILAAGSNVSGVNLATLPFVTWLGSENELPLPGTIFGSGSVASAISAGTARQNAIFAHPPDYGRTILSWVLAIPAGDQRLSWSAALADSATCTSGVRFEVRINGLAYWTQFQPAASGWHPGALDVSGWQGKNILLQLVTDSAGDFSCDHAWWADLTVTPMTLGTGTIATNAYGAITVQGADLVGNTMSNPQPNVVVQLGSTPGNAGSVAEIDFQGLNLGSGNTLTIKSGAAGQTVSLSDTSGTPGSIHGIIQAQGSGSIAAPQLVVKNPNGVTVTSSGRIAAAAGLQVDTLGVTTAVGAQLLNDGVLDGGNGLVLLAGAIHGAGQFRGNTISLSTFGYTNNPVNGSHYLSNGIQLYPATGADVGLILNLYGTAPQVLNAKVNGNTEVWMPSYWPAGAMFPNNSAPIPSGGVRPAGTGEPSFGGGSMIVQATGNLKLHDDGMARDFAFPGGIVLKAGAALDLNGVTVNQGWTTSGKAFQGIYFEAPSITSGPPVTILSNDLNWTNFSTTPNGHFQISRLVQMSDGSARYAPADSQAPHLNTYSTLIESAANGQCWVCLVNTTPINVQ
ncbi:MAG TPA: DUF6259 domain-containing protein [Casimicrobiaceae bacterium]|nr:DUF6259 domain-containing protein [Casimicrobiaceae bacterium]